MEYKCAECDSEANIHICKLCLKEFREYETKFRVLENEIWRLSELPSVTTG